MNLEPITREEASRRLGMYPAGVYFESLAAALLWVVAYPPSAKP